MNAPDPKLRTKFLMAGGAMVAMFVGAMVLWWLGMALWIAWRD